MADQEGVEQHASVEQEQGTTDLVLEGLMNENNKKQKSILERDTCVPCPINDDKREAATKASLHLGPSCEAPISSEHIRNPSGHCCSYAAVPPDKAVPVKGIQG